MQNSVQFCATLQCHGFKLPSMGAHSHKRPPPIDTAPLQHELPVSNFLSPLQLLLQSRFTHAKTESYALYPPLPLLL